MKRKDTSPNPHGVKVGQVWADNDWRAEGRSVEVIDVDDTHATVKLVTPARNTFPKPGRPTKIRLNRFKPTSTGYRLVEEVQG